MATGKKYYWIKLKKEFMTSDTVDFLMSQQNGANYVVIYQMLCLMCINTDGEMARQIGEVIIPFDVDKIVRDCKYFSKDTVVVALQLFKKLGLIYEQENGCLTIAEYSNLVGSETDYAKQKQAQRLAKCGHSVDIGVDNVHIEKEYRYKSIDNKEKYNKKKEIELRKIIPPNVEWVRDYCNERQNGIDAESFCDFYESKDWFVGKTKMKDWQAAVRNWERKRQETSVKSNKSVLEEWGKE